MLNNIRAYVLAMSFAGLALLALSSPANAQNRVIAVENDSSVAVYHLYMTNAGRGDWGDDWLGTYQTIGPERYRGYDLYDGTNYCFFDLKAVMSNGSVATHYNFNACAESKWTITD